MKKRIKAIVALLLALLMVSCSVRVNTNSKSETDMGSHHVVVQPGSAGTSSSSMVGGDRAEYEFTCGDVTVAIRNEELFVNDKSYGMLNPGEDVLIDHGKVIVGGQEREAASVADPT